MGRIRGWKKVAQGKNHINWRNQNSRRMLRYDFFSLRVNKPHEIHIGTSHNNTGTITGSRVLKGFNKKSQALLFARNFMRRHPRG